MKIVLLPLLLCFTLTLNSQITITRDNHGTMVTNLGSGIKVNKSSSLARERVVINDESCPLFLQEVGITSNYASGSGYSFNPIGSVSAKEPIVAYELHHILYNVFGEHMKTLSNMDVIDLTGLGTFNKYSSWYANENQVGEYYMCVSYVANVRTKEGRMWRYNYREIKSQLDELQISFDETYVPTKNKAEEK